VQEDVMSLRFLLLGSIAVLTGIILTTVGVQTQEGAGAPPPGTPTMTAQEFDRMYQETKNWGRWGKDDRLGTVNLITAAKKKQAAGLVKSGISVSAERDLSTEEAPDNPRPFKLLVAPTFRTDTWEVAYHGTYVTHLDALCHFEYQGMLYNGIPISAGSDKGCANGVEHFKNGIITRGVLIDIPRLKNLPYLEPATTVSAEEIEAWEKKAGIKIGPGDAVILNTGRWARRAKLGPWRSLGNAAGFHPSVARWLHVRDVSLVGADGTAEAQTTPPVVLGVPASIGLQPLHTVLISGQGMPLIDDIDPTALAETAARLNRWEFMIVVSPLSVPGGTGGPVNVQAIF
jgi:kynurenine formamidase